MKIKNIYKIIFFTYFSIFTKVFFAMIEPEGPKGPSFMSYGEFVKNYKAGIPLDNVEFKKIVFEFLRISKICLTNKSNFIEDKSFDQDYFDMQKVVALRGQAFGQKIIRAPGCKVILKSDIHGACRHLIDCIDSWVQSGYLNKENPLKINSKDIYPLFLGDNVDRGGESIKVLYLLMRLKIENPDNVFLIRGNHESFNVNKFFYDWYSKICPEGRDNFLDIFNELFGSQELVQIIYDALPSFLLFGIMNDSLKDGVAPYVNYILFSHAGIEPRFNPKKILEDKRSSVFQIIDELDLEWVRGKIDSKVFDTLWIYYNEKTKVSGHIEGNALAFTFSDLARIKNVLLKITNSRGIRMGLRVLKDLLDLYSGEGPYFKYSTGSIFRGHQHSELKIKLLENLGALNNWNEDVLPEDDGLQMENISEEEKSDSKESVKSVENSLVKKDFLHEEKLEKIFEKEESIKKEKDFSEKHKTVISTRGFKLSKIFPIWTLGTSPGIEDYGQVEDFMKILTTVYDKYDSTGNVFMGTYAVLNMDKPKDGEVDDISCFTLDKEVLPEESI